MRLYKNLQKVFIIFNFFGTLKFNYISIVIIGKLIIELLSVNSTK